MKITSRFLDVTRRTIRIEHTMSSDYCLGMKGFNFVERQKPASIAVWTLLFSPSRQKQGLRKREAPRATCMPLRENCKAAEYCEEAVNPSGP